MIGRIVSPVRLALAALCAPALAAPALACPPLITVERPGVASDSVFLLVHASPGCQRGNVTVTGTAEGLIDGARRSIALEVAATGTEGVYRVRRQWPRTGVWVLRLVVRVGEGSATALVGVGASGGIEAIREQDAARRIYPYVTDADVEAMLRSLTR